MVGKNAGYYSDKNGLASIAADQKDSLQIEYIGYLSRFAVLVPELDTIFLQRKEVDLQPIEINSNHSNCAVGSLRYRKINTIFFSESIEYASKIDLTEISAGYYKVRQLFLPLKINLKTFGDCVVKLHLYKEAENGEPGEELLKSPLILSKDELTKNNFYIDVSNQSKVLSERFLFLGIECIMDKLSMLNYLGMEGKRGFNQSAGNSPVSLYINNEKQFFSGGYGHTFTRLLNSRSYRWEGNTYAKEPLNFAAGLIVACSK